MDDLHRIRGSILGLAIGDALGHPTEFVSSVRAIRESWGEKGVTDLVDVGRYPAGTFTDDTQMTICVARALVRKGHASLDELMDVMGKEFAAWSRSRENNRAPGGTCLAGCRNFASGLGWKEAGVRNSKGCGAAMRAAPLGLYFTTDVAALVRLSAAQSSLTHRHLTGIASAVAAAAPVAYALREKTLDGMLAFTRSCVEKLDVEALVAAGCDRELAEDIGAREMLAALDATEEALEEEHEDVCQLLGGAWIGEEAVATALWWVIKAKGDFLDAVLRGANSSGDSDSIACIAGSIAGVLAGIEGVPADWVARVEKTDMLDKLARALSEARTGAGQELPDLDSYGAEKPPEPLEEADTDPALPSDEDDDDLDADDRFNEEEDEEDDAPKSEKSGKDDKHGQDEPKP